MNAMLAPLKIREKQVGELAVKFGKSAFGYFLLSNFPVWIKYTLRSLPESLIVEALQIADTNLKDKYRQNLLSTNPHDSSSF